MIGADEIVVHDRHWGTLFVTPREDGATDYLGDMVALGFEVVGRQVMATKRGVEVAFFSPAGIKARQDRCDHIWTPIPREGPRMACLKCQKEEY